MNTNGNRKSTNSGRRIGRRAVALAIPIGMLAASAAAPAFAAPKVDPGQAGLPANVPVLPVNLPIDSEGGSISLGGEADGKTYTTGPLEGAVTVLPPQGKTSPHVVGGALYSPVDQEGDFGQVRVRSAETTEAGGAAEKECVLVFEVEHLPGAEAEGPVLLQTDPLEFGKSENLSAFPPVNQPYSLQEPVSLYPVENGTAESEPLGTLEGFDVLVN